MEFINTGPVYIRGWAGGAQGRGMWWQKLKQRSKRAQIVEFRVAMMCTCTHNRPVAIPLQGPDRRALTVGAISGPHSQIGPLLWHHFTSHGFTRSAKSIQGKQTS